MNKEITEILENASHQYIEGNYKEAVNLYEDYFLENLKAGNKEVDSIASWRLATCYLEGLGTRRNISSALFHFDVVSDVYSEAAYILGVVYALGLYVRPSYAVALKYFNQAFEIQLDDMPFGEEITYSILIGDIYQYGIGVNQDKIRALMEYSEGFVAYAKELYYRAKLISKSDFSNYQKFEHNVLESLKYFKSFTKNIYNLIAHKDYQVTGSKKEITDIARLSVKELEKYRCQGNMEADIKMVYSLLLSKDYRKHKASIYRILNHAVTKNNIHAALLLAELAFKQSDLDGGFGKGLIALEMFKNAFIKSIEDNLKGEVNNPLYQEALENLNAGFKLFDDTFKKHLNI